MRSRQAAVVVGNGTVLIATNVVFRAWVDRTLGYLDLDMIGASGASWPLVVFLAIASAWLAFHVPVARMATAVLTLILVFIVVDHAFGALRDGEISTLGMVTGALMVLQVLMLVGSILLASRSGARVARAGIGLTFGVALALVLGGAVTFARVSGPAPKEAAVRDWLHGLAGGTDDRGWSYLSGFTRRQTDEDAYVADAARVDWDAFDWRLGDTAQTEGFWSVRILVDGGLEAVPRFFFDHHLAYPLCMDDVGVGIGVWVETPPIGEVTIDGGPTTGSMAGGRCGSPVAVPTPPPDPVRWAEGAARWTGATLEIWNRTQHDLFLVDEGRVGVELPACAHVATNALDLAQMVEVRAEEGYVFAFSAGDQGRRTTFMVVLPGTPSMNGVPSLPPLPPCEGKPQIQAGV